MNIFLTSLMHPETANNFANVLSNFSRSLRTICGQSSQNFKVMVVCNEIPNIEFQHPNILYVQVDFLPAKKRNQLDRRLDKASKLTIGLLHCQTYSPKFVYIFDADDWLSKHINDYLNSHSQSAGIYANSGYVVDVINRQYLKKFGMYRYCGSTFALDYDYLMQALNLPDQIKLDSSKEKIIQTVPRETLLEVLVGHGYKNLFNRANVQLQSFPFPAVAWVRNTGDNIREDVQRVPGRFFESRFQNQFALDNSDFYSVKTNTLGNHLRFLYHSLKSWYGHKVNLDHRT